MRVRWNWYRWVWHIGRSHYRLSLHLGPLWIGVLR